MLRLAETFLGERKVGGHGDQDQVGVFFAEFVEVFSHRAADAGIEARSGRDEFSFPMKFMERSFIQVFVDEFEIVRFGVDSGEVPCGVDGFRFQSDLRHRYSFFDEATILLRGRFSYMQK